MRVPFFTSSEAEFSFCPLDIALFYVYILDKGKLKLSPLDTQRKNNIVRRFMFAQVLY